MNRTWTLIGLLLGLVLSAPVQADDQARANAQGRLEAARQVYAGIIKNYEAGQVGLDFEKLYWWSRRWREAQHDLSDKKEDRIAAAQAHLERMRKLEGWVKESRKKGFLTLVEVAAQEFYRLEAEQWLAREKGK